MPFACPKCSAQFDAAGAGSPMTLSCPGCGFGFAAGTGEIVAAAAKVGGANVARLVPVGSVGQARYFASEYVEGDTVAELIRGGRTNPRMAALAAAQVADALEGAAAQGVSHGAISPESIVIDKRGIARLINLGLAAPPEPGQVRSSIYVAPERLGEEAVPADPKSDLYSLGAVLYEMLAGWPPYYGEDDEAVAAAMREGEIAPIRERNAKVHPNMERVVLKALSRDRGGRQRTLHEFAVDLRRHLSSTQGERTGVVPRQKGRSKVGLTLLVLVALAGAGAGGWFLWKEHSRREVEGAAEKRTHLAAAERLIEDGKCDSALTELTIAASIPQEPALNAQIDLLRGRARYILGKYDEALKSLAAVVASGARKELVLRAKGLMAAIKASSGDAAGAAAEFDAASKEAGPLAGIVHAERLDVARRLVDSGKIADALTLVEKMASGTQELDPAVEVEAGLLAAKAKERAGSPSEAAAICVELLRKHSARPTEGLSLASTLAELVTRYGAKVSLGSDGDRLLKSFAVAAVTVGRRHLADGRLDRAREWFAAALESAKADKSAEALARVMQAATLAAAGDAAGAEEVVKGIPTRYPDANLARAEARLLLGRLRLAAGLPDVAKQALEDIAVNAQQEGEMGRVAALAAVALGDVSRYRGDRDGAATAYVRASRDFKQQPEASIEALIGLADAYYAVKSYAEGDKAAKRILDEFPAAGERERTIASVLTGAMAPTKVAEAVEGRGPLFAAEIYYFAALRLERDGNIMDAAEYYRRAAELGSSGWWRTKIAVARREALEK